MGKFMTELETLDIDVDSTIADRFERIVETFGERLALQTSSLVLSYRELEHLANGVAHRFIDASKGDEAYVAIYSDDPAASVIGILAAAKLGLAYLPLDRHWPMARIRTVLGEKKYLIAATESLANQAREIDRFAPVAPLTANDTRPTGPPLRGSTSGDIAAVLFTSGTTGEPAGYGHDHETLLANAASYAHHARLTIDDRLALVAPFSAAASTSHLFGALMTGASLHPFDVRAEGVDRLLSSFLERRITALHATPTLFRRLVSRLTDGDLRLPSMRLVRLGGEPVLASDRELLRGRFSPDCRLYVSYSSTETLNICHNLVTLEETIAERRLPVGHPRDGLTIEVIGEDGATLPVGAVGEIVVLGMTVREAGPRNRPRGGIGSRHRTGDLGRLREDGKLEHLGRIDAAVKVRGFRVDPGEVERTLSECAAATQVAVVPIEERPGETSLVAYLAPDGKGLENARELRRLLLERIPDYMTPSAFIAVPSMPLTVSGKIDRRALSPSIGRSLDDHDETSEPRTPVEEQLHAIWTEVLGRGRIGAHDHFLSLGGHSLLAAQIVARTSQIFSVDLPQRCLFDAPTIAEMAERVEAHRRRGQVERPPLSPLDGASARTPLSFAQQRMWFLDQLEGDLVPYNMPFAYWLDGPIDSERLRRAFEHVVARHEPLRTTYWEIEGEPWGEVAPAPRFELSFVDLTAAPLEDREKEAETFAETEGHRSFDLRKDLMVRASLVRIADRRHLLVVVLHHVATDGWSMRLLWEELSAHYNAAGDDGTFIPPPLPVRYADFAVWQRKTLSGDRLHRLLAYWKDQLAGLPQLRLPVDRSPRQLPLFRARRHAIDVPRELLDKLLALARRENVSLHMILLAGFRALLGLYSGQDDIAISTPIAGRAHADLEPLIGFFANTLVLRSRAATSESFRALLGEVRRTCLDAYDHAELPFERLVEELRPERQVGRNPLVTVLFQVLAMTGGAPSLKGVTVQPVRLIGRRARFDLEVHLRSPRHESAGLEGSVIYNADLFEPSTIADLAARFHALLASVVREPDVPVDRLSLVTPAERSRLLGEWRRGTSQYPRDRSVPDLFEDQRRQRPGAIAVVHETTSWTYEELDQWSDSVAVRLIERGVGRGAYVAIWLERSPAMIAAALGILKAGAAYLPLDAASPPSRLRMILDDADVRAVISRKSRLTKENRTLVEGRSTLFVDDLDTTAGGRQRPPSPSTADDTAYLIYTSGSTGQPKGVAIRHRSIARLALGNGFARLGPNEVILQLAPLAFDASTFEIWGALLHGATLVQAPDEPPDFEKLEALIRRHRVTTLWLTARLFDRIIDERPTLLGAVEQILTGGEALSVPHVRRARELYPNALLINGYGPTESTTFACCHLVPAAIPETIPSIPIGRPIAGTTVYVLDHERRLVPPGIPGEIYLGGDGLAVGYHRQPELTAARFVPSPFDPGETLYRTGDRARWNAKGDLEFLGRIDDQVKLRGFRIEPGEIESAMLGHPLVASVSVQVVDDSVEPRLVAYWTQTEGMEATPARAAIDFRDRLRQLVPSYMIPAAFVRLNALPLTSNGKIDRANLPAPTFTSSVDAIAPRDNVERRLAGIWADALGQKKIGVQDSFFELGGSSLAAARLMSRVNKEFQRELPLVTLFQSPTVAGVAEAIRQSSARRTGPVVVPLKSGGASKPLYLLPSIGRELFDWKDLIASFVDDRPIHGIQEVGEAETLDDCARLEDLAGAYVETLRRFQPSGPYHLVGYSFGGTLAFEIARQLWEAGAEVGLLAIIDSPPGRASRERRASPSQRFLAAAANFPRWVVGDLMQTTPKAVVERTRRWLSARLRRRPGSIGARPALVDIFNPDGIPGEFWRRMDASLRLVTAYRPQPFPCEVCLFRATIRPLTHGFESDLGWGPFATAGVRVHAIPGHHGNVLRPPRVAAIADAIRSELHSRERRHG